MADDTRDPASPRHVLLRAWPLAAALFGLVGLAFAEDSTTFGLAALLVLGGLTLELAGWAEGIRIHARRLRRAALFGALVGATILGVLELRRPPAASADARRVAVR